MGGVAGTTITDDPDCWFRDSQGSLWFLDGPGGRVLAHGWRRVGPDEEGDVYYVHDERGVNSWVPLYADTPRSSTPAEPPAAHPPPVVQGESSTPAPEATPVAVAPEATPVEAVAEITNNESSPPETAPADEPNADAPTDDEDEDAGGQYESGMGSPELVETGPQPD